MKTIRLLILIILLIECKVTCRAQTMSFADKVVGLFNRLTELEKKYDKKRNAQISAQGSKEVNAATTAAIESTRSKINKLLSRIIRLDTVYLRHGLRRYESTLNSEKKFLEGIQKDLLYQQTSIVLSGGAGYNYTAFMKLLIRTLEIRASVLEIENKLDNLDTLNKVLIKR